MLYLTCIMISSVNLAHYGVSRAKDLVSVECGTIYYIFSNFDDTYFSFGYPLFIFRYLVTLSFHKILLGIPNYFVFGFHDSIIAWPKIELWVYK